MTLSIKGIAPRTAGSSELGTLLADGEEIIALVHDPHYALLFAHADEMYELLVAVGTGACDMDYRGAHSRLCKTCAARALLSRLEPLGRLVRTN